MSIYRSKIDLHNVDCMELMATYPDNYFELAIVDPPYGIGINKQSQGKGGGVAKKINYTVKNWDISPPDFYYFEELHRISKNQIIWGANHFMDCMPFLTNSPCWVVWDKLNGETDFADCELAWTSFKTSVRKFTFRWSGMLQGNMKDKEIRIHPTQKPVQLYKWLLTKYANKGDKILDTHLGSGSIAIACDELGFDLTACEIDKEYFEAAKKRLEPNRLQQKLFS